MCLTLEQTIASFSFSASDVLWRSAFRLITATFWTGVRPERFVLRLFPFPEIEIQPNTPTCPEFNRGNSSMSTLMSSRLSLKRFAHGIVGFCRCAADFQPLEDLCFSKSRKTLNNAQYYQKGLWTPRHICYSLAAKYRTRFKPLKELWLGFREAVCMKTEGFSGSVMQLWWNLVEKLHHYKKKRRKEVW